MQKESLQPTVNQLVMRLCKRRCLVGFQKGIFCKPIGRLLEAKRACIGFELQKNSLQTSVNKGNKQFVEDGKTY